MIRIPANDTQSINQVTGALIDSTSKADELTLEGQVRWFVDFIVNRS